MKAPWRMRPGTLAPSTEANPSMPKPQHQLFPNPQNRSLKSLRRLQHMTNDSRRKEKERYCAEWFENDTLQQQTAPTASMLPPFNALPGTISQHQGFSGYSGSSGFPGFSGFSGFPSKPAIVGKTSQAPGSSIISPISPSLYQCNNHNRRGNKDS